MQKFLIVIIRIYQKMISPMLGPNCRFYPTCSQYAIDALNKYGVLSGGWLTIKRVAKCHPFHKGGYDPLV